MIVVTVGTQLPFDRLIQMIDELAPHLATKVFAQTGKGTYVPKNLEWAANIAASDFDLKLKDASCIVSHAGIGTVLKAYKFNKPIILVPRRAALGEHRNDHQLATVSKLKERSGIYVAENAAELSKLLSETLLPAAAEAGGPAGRIRLRSFLADEFARVLPRSST